MSVESLFGQPLRVVNVGLELFARVLEEDGVTVIQVDWRPPAASPGIAALLARLSDES